MKEETKLKDMKKTKPALIYRDYYVVQNYGAFREMFYHFKDAKKWVLEEEKHYGIGELYQIYKCTVELKNPIQKMIKRPLP